MLNTHFLDEGGDIWRLKSEETRPQASGIVNDSYERVIPFRQQEFKNAFLNWIICDGVKHRKAASSKLKRCFKIANIEAAAAIPDSHVTVANWIHELFAYFEPQVIEELRNAKSKITITFNG